MSEAALRTMLRTRLSPYGIIKRIENRCDKGTPDILYCLRDVTGLIELKYLSAWPKRKNTSIRIASFTKDQAIWLTQWKASGGKSWLLLQIGRVYVLLGAVTAYMVQAGVFAKDELLFSADYHGPWDTPAILKVLTS